MEVDQTAALAKRDSMREAAAAARRSVQSLEEGTIEAVIDAFSRITPPEEPDFSIGLVTVNTLYGNPTAQSRKPGNIVLNWRKLMDIIPDTTLAGIGATTLPMPPAWSAVLAGLYIWNKVWRGSLEELSDAEATAILALWKNRNDQNRIAEDEAFAVTNELRATYSLGPLTLSQFASVIDHLVAIDCIELKQGTIWLREWVRIRYR